MKKSTMKTLVDFLANYPEMTEIHDELVNELTRTAEKSARNRELYDMARDIVLTEVDKGTYTVAEIYELVEDKLPTGFTRSKLQYALANYWTDEFEKIVNEDRTPNQYKKTA